MAEVPKVPTFEKSVSSKVLFDSPLYVSIRNILLVQILAADIAWVKVWRSGGGEPIIKPHGPVS